MTRADWDGLLAAGWTREQAYEAVHIVAIFEYFNRIAEAFGMESHDLENPMLLQDLHTPPANRP